MTAPVTTTARGRATQQETLHRLEALCDTLQPGDRIPTHTELMRRLEASERSVLRALDELQRAGRIVRRHGSGTFIAEPGEQVGEAGTPPLFPVSMTDSRTVVAVAVPDNSFFDRCMEQLFRHAEGVGLSLLCRMVNPEEGEPFATPIPPHSGGPLGFVLFHNRLMPLARRLQEQGCRVVVVGAPFGNITPDVPCVYSDHEQGGYLATRYLIDLGHRRITYGDDDLRTLRWQGHQRALAEAERAGRGVQATVLSRSEQEEWRQDPTRAAAYFRRPDAPTAIAAWNDHEAAKLSVTLSRAGLRIPDDISLVGYDALPEGELVYPPLTTLDQAMDRQLRAALDLLTRPTPPSPNQTVIVLPTLITRGSCAAPPLPT